MSYTLDDVCRLPLLEPLALKFVDELAAIMDYQLTPMSSNSKGERSTQADIQMLVYRGLILEDYKSKPEYILAETLKEKAKIAFEAKVAKDSSEAILNLWLKYADQMTEFEKIMQGWGKFL